MSRAAWGWHLPLFVILCFGLAVFTSCGGTAGEGDAVSLRIALELPTGDAVQRAQPQPDSALTRQQMGPGDPAFVTRLEIGVRAADIDPIDVAFDIDADEQTEVTVTLDIPRGENRQITAAFFNQDEQIFEGQTTVNLLQDVVSVTITLRSLLRFAYAANGGSNDISGYTMDAMTGALTTLPLSPFPTNGLTPTAMVAEPSGRFIYVTTFNPPAQSRVLGFRIDTVTGALDQIANIQLSAAENGPRALTTTADGRFLYVANETPGATPGSVSGFEINAETGNLTPVDGSPVIAGQGFVSVTVTPTREFVYVANIDLDRNDSGIFGFTLNRDNGVLIQIEGSPFETPEPQTVIAEPQGRFVHVIDSMFMDEPLLIEYSLNANGLLDIDADNTTVIFFSNVSMNIQDPRPGAASSRFIYVGDAGARNIFGFALGDLENPINNGTPFVDTSGNFMPTALTVAPDERFLYTANVGSNNVSGFSIDAVTGALTPLGSSPFVAGTGPISIVVPPARQ